MYADRTLAAIYHPALFSSLILVDPVILYPKPPYATRDGNSNTLAVGALGRRWVWRSKLLLFSFSREMN